MTTTPAATPTGAPREAPPKADALQIDGRTLVSRFFLGSAGYPSPQRLDEAIRASGTQVLTVGLKRTLLAGDNGAIAQALATARAQGAHLLPNTAGCRSAREAVQIAQMARELYRTAWIKLEVIGDDHTLQPDPFELLSAAAELARDGFTVFPYCTEDLILCRRLLDAGCPLLMPWGAPIGSGQGLLNLHGLRTLRERLPDTVLVIDAGLGAPSQAARAMELGFDAVLLNSAVAQARDPVAMAGAFRDAVTAGRTAFRAGLMAPQEVAVASTPVSGHAFLLGSP
ncbi:thiazole synthase [Roseateles amylovorans]|uniref:Thiazole synthase n=1 Tax=Roseateles amylovorans TaxID=2978473 RepID=A0ABY6B0Y3_9BURK|nr:thiazole synthase [Roseateles amylovorans]UXH77856.1 thiazole synthase [Roseateles amylovorans]